jgi:hypothetical protein
MCVYSTLYYSYICTDFRDLEPLSLKEYTPLPRPGSPFASNDVTQRVRQQNLITRYNDMFTHDRLDAMEKLRLYSGDHENNQRIVFAVMQVYYYVQLILRNQMNLYLELK